MEYFLYVNLEPTLIESIAKINFKTPTPIQDPSEAWFGTGIG